MRRSQWSCLGPFGSQQLKHDARFKPWAVLEMALLGERGVAEWGSIFSAAQEGKPKGKASHFAHRPYVTSEGGAGEMCVIQGSALPHCSVCRLRPFSVHDLCPLLDLSPALHVTRSILFGFFLLYIPPQWDHYRAISIPPEAPASLHS